MDTVIYYHRKESFRQYPTELLNEDATKVFTSTGLTPSELAEQRGELVDALQQTLGWLSSFSMPPTSTITEKQEAMQIIEAALTKATEASND